VSAYQDGKEVRPMSAMPMPVMPSLKMKYLNSNNRNTKSSKSFSHIDNIQENLNPNKSSKFLKKGKNPKSEKNGMSVEKINEANGKILTADI
jgi:hypothetical protein